MTSEELPVAVITRHISLEIAAQGAEFRGRIIRWAIEAAIANGAPRESVLSLIEGIAIDRHWWHIRQIVHEDALRSLYRKVVAEFGEIPGASVQTVEVEEEEWEEIEL